MRRLEFGVGLRRFLLVSVLCFLAFSSSAEVVLTDEEYSELLTQLDNSEKIQKQIENLYNEKLNELNERESDLKQRETLMNEKEADLSERVSDLQKRENSISVRETQIQILEASLKEQKQGQTLEKILNAAENVAWGLAGYGIGRYTR